MKYYDIKMFARNLRNNPTPSERILWEKLKGRKVGGRKFLRQHAIIYHKIRNDFLCYIPDFFCYQESLAIELDGKIHEYHKEIDEKRDSILNQMGVKVLRIKNDELKDVNSVLEKIKKSFTQTRFKK